MGKKSRRGRIRATSTPTAPRTLAPSTHPFFNSAFFPIRLTPDLLQLDIVKSFQELVQEGVLCSWNLGRKGTHISSHFTLPDGGYDFLTSPDPNDDNYEMLATAHMQSVIAIIENEAP